MKLRILGVIILGFSITAQANEVLLSANQPMKVVFRIAHKNQNDQAVFGKQQSVYLNKNVNVPISLNKYDRAGLVIMSVQDHELPPSANQFDQAQQCSMTTNKAKTTGALAITLSKHTIDCRTHGGVFG